MATGTNREGGRGARRLAAGRFVPVRERLLQRQQVAVAAGELVAHHGAKFDYKLLMSTMYGRFGLPITRLPNGSLRDEIRMPYYSEGESMPGCSTTNSNDFSMRRVNNGFIIEIFEGRGKIERGEYVFRSMWQATNFITTYYGK